jgi:hypothetical protein
MAKKNKPANAVKARPRVESKTKKKVSPLKKAVVKTKKAIKEEPPRKLFDAKKWFGAFPELKGPTLTIQRRMRDEW